ncbi:MAG: hypothetical protein Ta2G_13980 [Termitinemataceae bacterium]|nr:MAG: hypothetical protein Ta2G_13980 [Termitinemataceae bacterium]
MKKILLTAAVFAVVLSGVQASDKYYLPLSKNIFLLGYPEWTSSGYSSGGGPIFDPAPFSISLNPALSAPLERVSIDLGYSAFFERTYIENAAMSGHALHAGVLFPTKLGVLTVAGQGAFMPAFNANDEGSPSHIRLGSSGNGRFGWARGFNASDNHKIYIGAAIFGGGIQNIDYSDPGYSDYTVGADLGFVWRIEKVGFLKDVRVSAAATNLGKPFNPLDGDLVDFYSFLSFRGGVAAHLVDIEDKFILALSADAGYVGLTDFVFSGALQMQIVKAVTISASWDMSAQDLYHTDNSVHMPSVTLSYTHIMKSDKGQTKVLAGWQQLHQSVQMLSFGAVVNIGSLDTEAPEMNFGVSN